MRHWLLLLSLAACEKSNSELCAENPSATNCEHDAMIDVAVEIGPDARLSYGTGNYEVRLTTRPTGSLVFNGGRIDTTNNVDPCVSTAEWVSGQPSACFVVAQNINITLEMDVDGARPLVLLATDTLTINSTIDAASHTIDELAPIKDGPAANFSGCASGVAAVASSNGGGGGAGGSFMTQGGNGGAGENATAAGGVAAAANAQAPVALRGGCRGQQGAAGGTGGFGGAGGGAIYAIAGNTIDLRGGGRINASGAAGKPATSRGGGGGAGSGGMIVLYAPSILTDGTTRLVANGGGGSSGANDTSMSGTGGEPAPQVPTAVAPGGQVQGNCGNSDFGGTGFAGSSQATNGGSVLVTTCGGGGGGGGAGYIQANVAPSGGGAFSPTVVLQ